MDEQRLAEIEARLAAVTPGEWEHLYPVPEDYQGEDTSDVCYMTDDGWAHTLVDMNSGRFTFDDAEFIAAARADIPALIAEVRRLRAGLEMMRNHACGLPRTACDPEWCWQHAHETLVGK